jgi:hypothetical protein
VSLKHWFDTTVTLNDSWGPGAQHTLSTPLGEQPEFCLRARYLRDSRRDQQPAHFSVDFSSGYLSDGWLGVNFVPLGKDAVKGISGLPPYSKATRQTYRNKIEAVADFLDCSSTARLEGVVPHITKNGEIGYNRVKLFYVRNAVKGPIRDLVIIRIQHHQSAPGSVRANQGGTGNGPPH